MGGGTGPCAVAAACRLQAIFFGGGGDFPGIVLETAALRCCPRAVAVYCGDARTIARAARVRMGERCFHLALQRQKKTNTKKGAGCWLMTTTARASRAEHFDLRGNEGGGVGILDFYM